MEIPDLSLDYYSEFELLYEEHVRFYTHRKDVVFRLKTEPKDDGRGTLYSLSQGENGIYFFGLWDGYFSVIMNHVIRSSVYTQLPPFVKNWNEAIGWDWDEIYESIAGDDLGWLILKLHAVKSKMEEESVKYSGSEIACISDLIIFLEYVRNNEMELRISRH